MNLSIEFFAFTFDFLGKLMIAVTALLAHRLIVREKGVDDLVLKDMRLELGSGIIGIFFLILGYILHLFSF